MRGKKRRGGLHISQTRKKICCLNGSPGGGCCEKGAAEGRFHCKKEWGGEPTFKVSPPVRVGGKKGSTQGGGNRRGRSKMSLRRKHS